jgi:hypothetical protein
MALVRVLTGEYVVPYGTKTTTWSVHVEGSWTSITKVAGSERQTVSSGPGTVWQSLFEVRVPAGTWLLRIDTAPLPRRHDDPMSYLEREVRGARQKVTRRYYRVRRSGELVPAAREQAPT